MGEAVSRCWQVEQEPHGVVVVGDLLDPGLEGRPGQGLVRQDHVERLEQVHQLVLVGAVQQAQPDLWKTKKVSSRTRKRAIQLGL